MCHIFRILILDWRESLDQISIQDLTCCRGMVTLGSADWLANLPRRKTHLIMDVAQAPGPVRPVASAMFVLHMFTVVGAMPTAVCP